jgi:DNA-3-methyladenine glycosylase I
MSKTRCGWVSNEQIYIDYHDNEWGKPCHSDQKLFEMLLLEGFQAGLSWITILRKREDYRTALDNFDVQKCAQYGPEKVAELLQNEKLVRNRLKMNSIALNARAFMEVQQEFGSFANYIWSFVNNQTIVCNFDNYRQAPGTIAESDAMSRALKKRGFKFIGSTICLAFMQATGMVNHHEKSCFCA